MSGSMSTGNIRKPFMRLLPIQMAAVMVGTINGLVDTMFTSRALGENAVAGVGLFGPVMTIIYLSYALLNGAQIICGRAVGKGKSEEAASLFTTAAVTVLAFTVVLSAGGFLLRRPLSLLLGAGESTVAYLQDYIAGFIPGAPFMMLSGQFMMFMPCNNELKKSYFVMGIMVAVNTVLDYLALYVLDLGTFGLGLGSTLSYLISVVIMLPVFLRKNKVYHLNLKSIRFSRMKEALHLGLPDIAFNLGITLRSYLMNLTVMGLIGAAGMAALNVQNTLISFIGAIPTGTAGAYTILGSIYYGERDRKSLHSLTSLAMKTGTGLSCVVTAVLMAFSPLIASLFFHAGTEAHQLTQQMLMCFSSLFIWNSILNITTRAFRIQGYVRTVNALNLAEQGFTALVAVAGIRLIGVTAVWLSYPLSNVLCLAIVLGMSIIRLKRLPKNIMEWIRVPEDFGAAEENVLEFTVSGKEDVTEVSRNVMDFCAQKGIDRRRRSIAGLAVEEMAGNVIEHGLRAGKENVVEVRVVAEDSLIIRVRDNCPAFDPKQRIDQFSPEDPAKNAGIRLIAGLAQKIDYHNDAGINTLLIEV